MTKCLARTMTLSLQPKYLVIFYGVSAGSNGANLGCDEQDLVTLVYCVLDTEDNKVRVAHCNYVLAPPSLP